MKRRHEQQSDSESFFASIESDQVLDSLREMKLDIPEKKEESPERIEELPVEENPFENLEEKEASGLPPAEVPDLAPAEVPEWLARIRARKISEAGPTKPLSLPEEMDWTDKLHEKEVPVAPVVEVETPEAEAPLEQLPVDKISSKPAMQDFDLLRQMLSTEEPAQTAPFDQSQAAEEQEPAESIFEFEEAGKDVEKLLSEDILEDENRPQWLRDLPPEPPIELPHIPALVDESEQMNGGAAAADVEIAGVGLPSWLEDLEKGEEEGAAEEAEPSEPEHHLAPATLPAWLEAMRPVETFGSLIADEEEKAEAVEVAGPLAGLQGVLSAEPVVAMPRTPIIGGAILDVTEREYARAEVLRRMIEDEERELPAKSKRIVHAPITRWAINLTMLLAILLPYILGIPSSPPPIREPNDMASLITLIDNLSIDRPTLLVFDYDPGYSGELEAVAGSPLNHLILRNMPIVTLSTQPEGPLLAARLLEKVGGDGLQNGIDYLHLGYLSGGSMAVQLFAAAPRQAIIRGFQLPENLNGNQNSAWSMDILKNITDLSDFSMVIVITSGAEDARTWAEQAGPRMGSAPLVMILSAGVEPLVRPYYETADKQVDGILSGLPAAVAYDKRFQRVGEPQLLWNAFGSGILFSSLILIVGGGYGVAVGFWRRRGARRENEA
jgi:hypothetical protein